MNFRNSTKNLSGKERGKTMSNREKEFKQIQVATLGGGCFWCLEAVYEQLQGIEKVVSGYSGGTIPNPSYELVCTGTTGHVEVTQLTFDSNQITFREILEIFFTIHDPTTLNRQGADVGPQYRSVIFYHDEEQLKIAEEVITELEEGKIWKNPLVTEVAPFTVFYPAEDYHHGYYRKNPAQGYCRVVIAPKLSKFRTTYMNKLKKAFA